MKARVTYVCLVEKEPLEIEVSPIAVQYIEWVENRTSGSRPSDAECLIAMSEIRAQVRKMGQVPNEVGIDISKSEVLKDATNN